MKDKLMKVIGKLMLGEFQWVNLSSSGSYPDFKPNAYITPKGFYHNISCSKTRVTEYTEHLNDYKPENLFNGSFKSIKINRSSNILIKEIADNLKLVVCTGGSYNRGLKIEIAIYYYGVLTKIYEYSYSTSDDKMKYEGNCYFDKELFGLIDFSYGWINPQTADLINNFPSSNKWFLQKDESNVNYIEWLKLAMDGNTITLHSAFISNHRDYVSNRSNFKIPRNALEVLGVEKIIIKDQFWFHEVFDIPNTLKTVIIDNKDSIYNRWGVEYAPQYVEENEKYFLEGNPTLAKFVDLKYAEYENQKQIESKNSALFHTRILIDFQYKNIKGTVITNRYRYKLCKEYYKKLDNITLDFAGIEIVLTNKDFFNCLTETTHFKSVKRIEQIQKHFGTTIGYTDWWLTDFDEYLQGVIFPK